MVKSVLTPAQMEMHKNSERHSGTEGGFLRQVILGGQDGLVNVLGLILGVAGATNDPRLVIIAGLAATAAESISMAAVAYTSSKAERDHYFKEVDNEKWEMDNIPDIEREEIRLIYLKKGFKGKQLESIVNKVCSNHELWLQTMMDDELGLKGLDKINPLSEAAVVGFSAVFGSLIPLVPFVLTPGAYAIPFSLTISIISLFVFGAYKSKLTLGNWFKSGLEMALIGFGAAMAGYAIGLYLGVTI